MRNLIRAAAACGIALVMLVGCGRSDEAEKSIDDISGSVHDVQGVLVDEKAAVKAGDARAEVETTQAVAAGELDKLRRFAERAPADTQDFADAALEWTEAVEEYRSALLGGSDSDVAALIGVRVNDKARALNEAAEELDVDNWKPVHTF
ncbi:hypothetical protein [Streptomyces sp. NPDC056105]|uniref:hypothetical protein n=1 Tax=Streptomyces sp. NPDC056105 TaxID=3345714 RepID=UPI0035E388DB